MGDSGLASDMGLSVSGLLETFSSFWSTRYSMDKYWQACWLQGMGGVGGRGSMAGSGRWAS